MTEPIRLQLSRRKGFCLQTLSREVNGLEAVNVARPTKWGNPFVAGIHGADAADCVEQYRTLLGGHVFGIRPTSPMIATFHRGWEVPDWDAQRRAYDAVATCLSELKGKNLACWCPLGSPCHAELLLEIANHGRCK
ncbi:MAG: DUF4326 domain-containing protein [Methyloligellaceae bacterium]